MPPQSVVAVLGSSDIDPREIALAAGRQCRHVASARELRLLHETGQLHTLIYFAGRSTSFRGRDVAAVLERSCSRLLVVVGADTVACHDLLACAEGGVDLSAVLGSRRDVLASVRAAAAPAPGLSPLGSVLRQVGPRIPARLRTIATAAAVLGVRRCTAAQLTAACQYPERTARSRLRTARWPGPHALPAWFLGTYIAFWSEGGDLEPGQVARRAGFSSSDQLRRYLVARTGSTPTVWRDLGFADALRALADRLGTTGAGG